MVSPVGVFLFGILSMSMGMASARSVSEVKIAVTGRSEYTDEHATAECKAFQPTIKQVKAYFERAYPVPPRFTMDTYYSPCYAEGTVEFSDGSRGEWRLHSSGAAGMDWLGSSGGVQLLYRKNAWRDPEGGYDIH